MTDQGISTETLLKAPSLPKRLASWRESKLQQRKTPPAFDQPSSQRSSCYCTIANVRASQPKLWFIKALLAVPSRLDRNTKCHATRQTIHILAARSRRPPWKPALVYLQLQIPSPATSHMIVNLPNLNSSPQISFHGPTPHSHHTKKSPSQLRSCSSPQFSTLRLLAPFADADGRRFL